eukprot:m.403095 g.403095  ORF g.403095 m.403095 type:complete len:186 (+) comp20120_c0_seq3:13606-14163(+)
MLHQLLGCCGTSQTLPELTDVPSFQVWKQLVGQQLTVDDIAQVDEQFAQSLQQLRTLGSQEEFELGNFRAATTTAAGDVIDLFPGETDTVSLANRDRHIQAAIDLRCHECDQQVAALRRGLGDVLPLPLLNVFTGPQLETLVCGSQTLDLAQLRKLTKLHNVADSHKIIGWFWEVLEELSASEHR